MLVIIIFLLFITAHESKEESRSINMKIYRDQILTSSDTTETMRNIQYNKIYINSKIGSSDKSIKLYIRFNEYITYITDNYYKKEESNSYEFTRKKEGGNAEYIPNEFHTDDLNTGYESKDKLILDENILKDFNFILVDKLKREKEFYYPIIGLNLVKENNIRPALYKTNFLEQLKSNNFIDNKIFSILYFNKENKNAQEKGEIIFGKLPHELNEKEKFENYKLEENNLYWDNAEVGEYNLKWKLKFERIKYGNEELSEISGLIAELIIEQNLFTGTWEFKNIIHKKFFEELISKKICKEEKFYNYRENFHYFFYSCDSSLKSELSKKKYKDDILQFKSNSLNEIFTFNLEELFIKVGQTLFFSEIFDEYQMYGWKLGNIFFEKYPLVFSLDNKAIGYYNQNSENMKNKTNNKIIYILIGLVLLLSTILFIGFRRYNILKRLIPRKIKANELLDDYSYNSNNINNEDNNKNEIRTEMAYKTKISGNNESKLGV